MAMSHWCPSIQYRINQYNVNTVYIYSSHLIDLIHAFGVNNRIHTISTVYIYSMHQWSVDRTTGPGLCASGVLVPGPVPAPVPV